MAFHSPYAGFDRDQIYKTRWVRVKDKQEWAQEPELLIDWMNEMYRRSNFEFSGMYLSNPKSPEPGRENELTGSSKNEHNGWAKIYPELTNQGWGIAFFYVGYTVRFDMPDVAPKELLEPIKFTDTRGVEKTTQRPTKVPISRFFPKSLARDRGILHGKHIRLAISELSPDSNGAVVYLDNEGSTKLTSPELQEYYVRLFEELRRPGGDNDTEAVRPGLYTFENDFRELLPVDGMEDLFIWRIHDSPFSVWRDTFDKRQNKRPYKTTLGRLTVDLSTTPVTPLTIKPEDKRPGAPNRPADQAAKLPMTATSVAGQWFNDEDYAIQNADGRFLAANGSKERAIQEYKAHINLPMVKVNDILVPMQTWDLDMSLVRDPRYPEANPRFRMNGPTLLRGDYQKVVEKNDKLALPDAILRMVVRDAAKPATPIDETQVEPEAPILLPTPDMALTINKDGKVASASRTGGTWGKFTALPVGDKIPNVRRQRAATANSSISSRVQLFYITRDQRIQARTSMDDGGWSDAIPLGDGIKCHPFSNVTSAYIPSYGVNVYFVDSDGLLAVASWREASSTFPGTACTALQDKPPAETWTTILNGTAIAVATPSRDHQLVFTVGRDLRLHMTVYATASEKWTRPPMPQGNAKTQLFAHTRLATYCIDESHVLVAAISMQGVAVVYKFELVHGVWLLPNPPSPFVRKVGASRRGPIPAPPYGEALSWTINPFSDLAIGSWEGDTILLCAGTSPGETGLLMRRIDKPDAAEDWLRVLGGEILDT